MSPQLWSEGDLRSTTLGTNGFPRDHEPALPDELFLGTDEGEVQIIREVEYLVDDSWAVSGPGDYDDKQEYADFEAAFKAALLRVREVSE